MKTRYALALIAAAVPLAAWNDARAAAPRSFYLNQWGGVNGCNLARRPTDRAYCAGADNAARDPSRFDCREAEVDSELAYCARRIPLPPRRPQGV